MADRIQKITGPRGIAYLVRVEYPRDPITGKRKQRSASFKTKKAAEVRLAEWLTEIERGTAVDGSKMTVAEYLRYWLGVHGHNLRPSTRQQYTSLVNAHLIPSLGEVALQKLQPAHLTAMYAEKRTSGRRQQKRGDDDTPRGLAPRSVRHLHVVLHEALDFAVKHQIIVRNVADAVDAPRFSRKGMATWTPDEIRRFLETAQGDTYDPIWLLMLTTGLRRGEALGVRWRDIDFSKGTLAVVQSIIDVGGHAVISEPKTRAGRRIVRLSPACLATLADHRERQRARKIVKIASDLVFTTGDGNPVQPRVLSRAFDVLQRKAKVSRIRLHDVRHTHATLLFNDGKNIKMISQRLGHADVGITLSVYAHLAEDAQDEAASSIDGLIFGKQHQDGLIADTV